MDDAGLDRGLRKDRRDRLRKALQAVDHGDQDVLDPARAFKSFMTLSQNSGAFGRLDPEPENILRPVGGDREREILRTHPSSRILTRMASKKTSG